MECSTFKIQVSETFSRVKDFSSEEDRSFLNEEKVNAFLDSINELKSFLNEKTNNLNQLNERVEKLTWHDDVDDEALSSMKLLIVAIKEFHSTLIKNYVALTPIRLKGIAKEEIKAFKNALDDLREIHQDLESVFFSLPSNPDFNETTKQLSLI